jgi:hypothetical protein
MNAPVLPAFALEEFPDFIQPRVDMPSSWLSEQVMIYPDERIWQLKDLLGGTFAVHPEIGKLKVFISEGKWSASSLLMHIAAVLGVQICLRSGEYRVEASAVHRDVARNKSFVDGERANSLKLVSMLERYLTPPYVSTYMESLGSQHFYSGQLTPLSAVNPELRRLVTDLLPEDVGWEAITLRFVFSLTVGCRHSEEAPPVAGLENFAESIANHLIAAIPASEFRFNLPKLPRHYCVDPADAMREHGAVVRYPA